ncbi:hypothetical protein Tco_0046238 [Tanacetum coccineum]
MYLDDFSCDVRDARVGPARSACQEGCQVVDILSREDVRVPDFDPLETANDQANEEESLKAGVLVVLLAVLSMDVARTLEAVVLVV